MTISTNVELLSAIPDWANRSAFGAALIADFVTLTEAIFNYGDGKPGSDDYIAPLRCREMITVGATVTITSGQGNLPTDFMEMLIVGTSTRTLQYVPPDWYTENYPTGQSSDPLFYTIIGSIILSGADLSITYYTKIGPLATALTWLLTKAPNAYLHGGLYHLYLYDKDGEKAQIHKNLMASAIEGLRTTDNTSIIVTPQRRASMVAW